jgi:hypothetical protein
MNTPSITVLSVSWWSAAFLNDLFTNLLLLADHPEALRFVVADNTRGEDADLLNLDFPALIIVPVDVQGEHMSMAHAAGLNALLPFVDSQSPFVLVVDPDIAVLQRGWDNVLCRALDAPSVAAVGAPYPPWKLGKYHDFPSPPFAFWHTETLKALSPDWRPYGRTAVRRFFDFVLRQTLWLPRMIDRYLLRLPRRRFKMARWVERIVGVVSKDTGWEIAAQARRRGWRACLFDVITRPDHDLLPSAHYDEYRALAAEFELYAWEGKPFVTHRNPTRTRLAFNLWTANNILIYQNRADSSAQTVRWRDLVAEVLPSD